MGNLDSAERCHPVVPQLDLALPFGHLAGADGRARLATTEFEDHPRGDLGAPFGGFRVDAALEAVARVRFDLQLAARRGDGNGIEQRNLKEHLGCLRRAAGIEPAHHTGQALGLVAVADDGHLAVEFVFALDQRHELLAVARTAHGQRLVIQLARIEDVERTAQIQRDVVGHVHQRRDRPQAHGHQPVLHPLRRGAVRHVPEVAAHNVAAGIAVFRDLPSDGRLVATLDGLGRVERLQLAQPGRGQVARDSAHAGAVRAVRGELDVDDRVVDAENFREGLAQRRVPGKLDDTLMLVRQAHLALGD